jgi:hypothetical protein
VRPLVWRGFCGRVRNRRRLAAAPRRGDPVVEPGTCRRVPNCRPSGPAHSASAESRLDGFWAAAPQNRFGGHHGRDLFRGRDPDSIADENARQGSAAASIRSQGDQLLDRAPPVPRATP